MSHYRTACHAHAKKLPNYPPRSGSVLSLTTEEIIWNSEKGKDYEEALVVIGSRVNNIRIAKAIIARNALGKRPRQWLA